jgi:pimeloyl-ACP methyl ester carboxylesterase
MGDNDRMVPVQYSKGFTDEIPNYKLQVIRDCGHIPPIEKPIEFSKIILDFLLKDENNKREGNIPM